MTQLATIYLALAALAGPGPALVSPRTTPEVHVTVQAPEGEPLLVEGQDVVKEHKLVRLSLKNAPNGYTILWDVHPFGVADKATNAKLKSVVEFTAPPGVYQVQVRAIKGEDVLEAFKTITIQPAIPTPMPPGPGPGPGPLPPGPGPAPGPAAPIEGDGNRVLIVYESGDPLPAPQAAVITSGILRDYLDAKCAKDQFNPAGAYRIWDKDQQLTHPSVSPSWKAAMQRPRQSLPWIIISNGKTGFEGPLPADVPQTLALLKKYLGD